MIFLFLIVVSILFYAFIHFYFSRVEQPVYTIIKNDSPYQIRKYPQLLVARTIAQGSHKEALNSGFNVLVDYIKGNNTSNQKIPMTAPVLVTQQDSAEKNWSIEFIMPASFTLETIAQPNNQLVSLHMIPESTYATIQFSGTWKKDNLKKHYQKLEQYVQQAKNDRATEQLRIDTNPVYAFYNPPIILPFLRRNEVWLKIEN